VNKLLLLLLYVKYESHVKLKFIYSRIKYRF